MQFRKDQHLPIDTAELRRQAEEHILEANPTDAQLYRAQEDTLHLVHELQVTQIELEMQNMELRQARDDVESALLTYTNMRPPKHLTAIKVLLVDDHKILRDGLAALLGDAEDINIVAEASDGREAVKKSQEHAPDVVVMDLSLPGMGGIESTRRILEINPDSRVLVLSMLLDRNCVLESLEAGAKGYLVKDCASEELVVAIRAIFAGKPYFCAGATEIMIKGFAPRTVSASGQIVPALTKREQEVLKLTARGYTTKETAFELGVSIKMIETHRKHIKQKLGLKNIAQLITYAARSGLISIDGTNFI